MSTILHKIFEAKRARVDSLRRETNVAYLADSAKQTRRTALPRTFREAIGNPGRINVIAEFKRASPSKGIINGTASPEKVVREYESGGAAAISVITEEDFFCGSIDDLCIVRQTVSLPVLRKDFIFDEYQIYEAAVAGADAVLLIASSLNADELRRLRHVAEDELGMDALVEVHTEEEMSIAGAIGATIIGVNNRDLKTFEVSLDVSQKLAHSAPSGTILIAESGIRTRQDIDQLLGVGYSAFLIGENLMRSDNVENTVRELVRAEPERA